MKEKSNKIIVIESDKIKERFFPSLFWGWKDMLLSVGQIKIPFIGFTRYDIDYINMMLTVGYKACYTLLEKKGV